MTTSTRVLLVLALLATALILLRWLRSREGRVRLTGGGPSWVDDLGHPLGERATLVQFSTQVCGPCRAAARVLSTVAGQRPGVRHVELDAEERLELVRRLDIRRTPTVLVLDRSGREVARAGGVPTVEQIDQALAEAS